MKASIFSVDRTIIWGFSLLASLFVVDGELDCTVCDGLSGYERMNDPNLPEPEILIRGRIIEGEPTLPGELQSLVALVVIHQNWTCSTNDPTDISVPEITNPYKAEIPPPEILPDKGRSANGSANEWSKPHQRQQELTFDRLKKYFATGCHYMLRVGWLLPEKWLEVYGHRLDEWKKRKAEITMRTNQIVPICSGTILNPNYILTAAHCAKDLQSMTDDPAPIDFEFYACAGGDHKLTHICTNDKTRRRFYRDSIDYHSDYDTSTQGLRQNPNFDVGIIRLETPFNLKEIGAGPVCLLANNLNDFRNLTFPILAGYGPTEALFFDPPPPPPKRVKRKSRVERQEVDVHQPVVVGGSEQLRATNVLHKVLKKDEDPMVHRHLFPFMKDACGEGTSNMRDRQMLCAISHTSSPCQADSGGPLFVWTKLKAKNKTSSMSLYQIGVLSGILPKKVTAVVPRCGKGNYLTYTKTRPLFDWLTEHTNETCKLEINPKDLDKVD